MSSIVPPFVSGMKNTAHTSCTAIMNAKNANAAMPARSATAGNTQLTTAQRNQCVKHPSACPFARTVFGNTSEMYTQMTAPDEQAEVPVKELKGFEKVWLEPGQTKTVTCRSDAQDIHFAL